jgi:hypothetical protein
MSLSLAIFTLVHVIISLVAIFSGFVLLTGFFASRRLDGWTALFLITTVATSVTGFLFPVHHFMPSHVLGFFFASIAPGASRTPTRRTIMKVFALGLFAKPLTDEQRKRILPKEVPDTLRLYLDGKIDQFWFREDKPGGVVFLMNCTSVEEARWIIEALPLAANGYLVFEYVPVGPLQPLGLLIQSPQAE